MLIDNTSITTVSNVLSTSGFKSAPGKMSFNKLLKITVSSKTSLGITASMIEVIMAYYSIIWILSYSTFFNLI